MKLALLLLALLVPLASAAQCGPANIFFGKYYCRRNNQYRCDCPGGSVCTGGQPTSTANNWCVPNPLPGPCTPYQIGCSDGTCSPCPNGVINSISVAGQCIGNQCTYICSVSGQCTNGAGTSICACQGGQTCPGGANAVCGPPPPNPPYCTSANDIVGSDGITRRYCRRWNSNTCTCVPGTACTGGQPLSYANNWCVPLAG